MDKALIFVSLLVYLKKDYLSVSPFKKLDLNMILRFLIEIKMPLVIQGLLDSFFCRLDEGFRGACLSLVLSVTREKRLNNSLEFSMVRGG